MNDDEPPFPVRMALDDDLRLDAYKTAVFYMGLTADELARHASKRDSGLLKLLFVHRYVSFVETERGKVMAPGPQFDTRIRRWVQVHPPLASADP